ncbi:twin transmembrane helix small protein [Pinisolibacter aquiterrae]|uniref:twin transmembrane helix small protein n=1 Tax=Pinisolibacter aquiterrae TaxID=2815579 RepID=UPI001C3DEF51|nr:twin transmembrane helix small protein [Pinisolibacter aquiterrae]MBV5264736.1 twin transmembrane helix small protein [Pinisolibacter aquiterrae]MCC8233505.1 twin transmembrane helix small protein [Pinisolibacter aquiterrae]
MTTFLGLLLAGALVAVLVVLGLGVLNMAKGGSPQRSQALMRARVGLQALALVLLLAFLFTRS